MFLSKSSADGLLAVTIGIRLELPDRCCQRGTSPGRLQEIRSTPEASNHRAYS